MSVHAVPFTNQGRAYYTHTITLRVGRRLERVYISSGLHAGNDATPADNINTVLMWVGTAQVTLTQKQALIRTGRTYLKRCMTGATTAQLAALQRLVGTDWTAFQGWKDQQLGRVKVGWGMVSFGDRDRSALSVEWPPTLSRCPF